MTPGIDNMKATRRNRWRPAIWGGAALLLLLPAVAMRLGTGVDWDTADFLVMALMLSTACGGYELATRISGSTAYRAGAGVAIATVFITVWVNLAVGMLGSEDNRANLLFGGVLLVALLGAVVARFRPPGMARAMGAAALAQAMMVGYAVVAGHASVALHIGLLAIPWLLSAQLFRRAAREMTE